MPRAARTGQTIAGRVPPWPGEQPPYVWPVRKLRGQGDGGRSRRLDQPGKRGRLQARDQIGLLYRLAKTISDHNFDITFARIGTERGVAIDTFYIENASHEQIESPERLHILRDALNEVITPAPVAMAAAK